MIWVKITTALKSGDLMTYAYNNIHRVNIEELYQNKKY